MLISCDVTANCSHVTAALWVALPEYWQSARGTRLRRSDMVTWYLCLESKAPTFYGKAIRKLTCQFNISVARVCKFFLSWIQLLLKPHQTPRSLFEIYPLDASLLFPSVYGNNTVRVTTAESTAQAWGLDCSYPLATQVQAHFMYTAMGCLCFELKSMQLSMVHMVMWCMSDEI